MTYNVKVDSFMGWVGDHIEPGMSVKKQVMLMGSGIGDTSSFLGIMIL